MFYIVTGTGVADRWYLANKGGMGGWTGRAENAKTFATLEEGNAKIAELKKATGTARLKPNAKATIRVLAASELSS